VTSNFFMKYCFEYHWF